MARTKSKSRKGGGRVKAKGGRAKAAKSKRAGVHRGGVAKARKAKAKGGGRAKAAKRGGAVRKGRATARKSASRASAGRKGGRRTAAKGGRTVRRPVPAENTYGEGNYAASREFRTEETDFVRRNRGDIPRMGKEAEAALEGSEGKELRAAEAEAGAHAAGGAED